MIEAQPSGVDLVKRYLRAQNLEQLGRIDEAIAEYERAVTAGFDSPGPYDRLIALYAHRSQHREVVRIAEKALLSVHTYADKRAWYETARSEAQKALTKVPQAAPKKTS